MSRLVPKTELCASACVRVEDIFFAMRRWTFNYFFCIIWEMKFRMIFSYHAILLPFLFLWSLELYNDVFMENLLDIVQSCIVHSKIFKFVPHLLNMSQPINKLAEGMFHVQNSSVRSSFSLTSRIKSRRR